MLTLGRIAFDGPGAETMLAAAGFSPDRPYARKRYAASMGNAMNELFGLMRDGDSADSKHSSEDGSLRYALIVQSALLRFLSELVAEEDTEQRASTGELGQAERKVH